MQQKLVFNENYEDFGDFYEKNKDIIYDETLKLFEGFINLEVKEVSLIVCATIQTFDWSTEIKYTRQNYKILKKEILNYYESIDDFETCQKIINLYNELTS